MRHATETLPFHTSVASGPGCQTPGENLAGCFSGFPQPARLVSESSA